MTFAQLSVTRRERSVRRRLAAPVITALAIAFASFAIPAVAPVAIDGLHIPSAHADDAKKVEKLKKKGDKYLERGDKRNEKGKGKRAVRYWEKALDAYQKANELVPSPELVLAIARVEVRLERHIDAIDHLQKVITVLEDGDIKNQATEELEALKPNVAMVSFDIKPEGAELSVDGQVRGTAPLTDPLYLAPGEHTFKVTAEGVDTHEETLSLEAGGESTRQIYLGDAAETKPDLEPDETDPEPEVTDPVEPDKPDVEPDTPSPLLVPNTPVVAKPGKGKLIIGSALTVGFVAGATVTGFSALSKHGEFEDETNPAGVREDAKSSGETLALVTDLLIVGAVAAGSYTIYHYVSSYGPRSKAYDEQERRNQETNLVIAPYVSGQGGGLAVTGRF